MTTVDLYVDPEGDGTGWALHNGLTGPATALGHAIWNRLLDDDVEAVGPMNCAAYKARLSGAQLRQIMSETDLTGWQYATGKDPAALAAALDADRWYVVQLIEF